MGNRFGWAWIATACLLTSQVIVPDPVGSTLGSTNCSTDFLVSICIANNYTHTVYADASMRTDIKADLTFVVNETWDNDTQLASSMTTDFTNADVRGFTASYGPSPVYFGATYCPTYGVKTGSDPNMVCKPQVMRFNIYWTGYFDTINERRSLACHEVGHTVGMHHNPNPWSCMTNATSPPIHDHPDALDIQDVNTKYNPY